MAKHDQRILKFLNQNADRGPTITEMMTRLNISISDISESLESLQAQALISKKVDSQGIESWFPGSQPQTLPSGAMNGLNPSERAQLPPLAPTTQFPAVGAPVAMEARAASARSPFHADLLNRDMTAPQSPQPRLVPIQDREDRPVQVQHVAVTEPSQFPMGLPVSQDRNGIPSLPQLPVFKGSSGMHGLIASRSIGFLTLLTGLVISVALSTFITIRLIQKELRPAAFADRKAFTDANAALADFQAKTKAHVSALEAQVRKLSEELAASKAASESLKATAAVAPGAAKAAGPAAKAGKAEAKAAEARRVLGANGGAMGKPAKGKKAVAAKPKPTSQSALAKAAARGAAMRKKSPPSAGQEPADDLGEAVENPVSSSSPATESPDVPNPPGLDDLPPPPAE